MVDSSVVVLVIVASVFAAVVFYLKAFKYQMLHPREYQDYKLIAKSDVVSPADGMHTMKFRFEVPGNQNIGLPIGQHIILRGKNANGDVVSRPYSPVSGEDVKGFVEFIIKIYPNGAMGNYLKNLTLGSFVAMRGPTGHLKYKDNGVFEIKRPEQSAAIVKKGTIGMIAGGSGITPMLQIVRHCSVNRSANSNVKLSLIFGNQTEKDIICRSELESLTESNSNFNLWFTLDKPSESWTQGRGYIVQDMVQKHLPAPSADTLILLCGPPPMCNAAKDLLSKMGYSNDMIFEY